MQSPGIEWVLLGAYATAVDVIRAHGDPDHDTLSEVVRDLVDSHPLGRPVFTGLYAAGAIGLWRHICKPKEK